jgi:hypothetical protein
MSTNDELKNETANGTKPVLAVRSCALAKNDMGDDLCKYCPLEKKGVYGVDGGYMAGCEGSRCDDAYDNYLESVGE